MSKHRVISGPYFPAFGVNTERYFVSLRIHSECGKIRTRNYSVFGHFSHSDIHTEHWSVTFTLFLLMTISTIHKSYCQLILISLGTTSLANFLASAISWSTWRQNSRHEKSFCVNFHNVCKIHWAFLSILAKLW